MVLIFKAELPALKTYTEDTYTSATYRNDTYAFETYRNATYRIASAVASYLVIIHCDKQFCCPLIYKRCQNANCWFLAPTPEGWSVLQGLHFDLYNWHLFK